MQLRDITASPQSDMTTRLHEEKALTDLKPRAGTMLPTRYFGRKSKTIPSRALKRRYVGPPKSPPAAVPSRPPAVKEEEQQPPAPTGGLTTPRHYYLPERPAPTEDPVETPHAHIHVPSWKLKPFSSFYQMEGTENINDPVFERRHQKYELDERRRKRWDLQRVREQRAGERKKQRAREERQPSFFPHPRHVECVEVTEQLPVVAFGHAVPAITPSDFSLPWSVAPSQRRGRPSVP